MALLDMFALAQANEDALAKQFEDRRSPMIDEHAARFDMFCQNVKEHGGISVNMKPHKLLLFLRCGRYLSAYELAEERAITSGRSAEDEFRREQGCYYARRVLFERTFEDGERFLYGALNIGGAGASEYGLFCAFLNDAAMRALRSAFFPDDSLKRYVKPAPVLELDESALRREVAAAAQRHCLAAIKHADDVVSIEASDWPAMLCSRECYVEAIFVGDVSPDHVAEFRIKRDERRRLYDLAFDDMMGKVVPSDRAELDEFRESMEKLDHLGLASRIREV